MSVSNKHVFQQGPVLATLAGVAAQAVRQRMGHVSRQAPQTPTEEIVATVAPRPADLVRDYVRHVGGDPSAYRGLVPPHMFPQWGFPLAARTLRDIPYPIAKALNGGCRMEMNAPLPAGEPLVVRARLERIDDNGRRAVLEQRVVTGTASEPDALVARLFAVIPAGGSGERKAANGKSAAGNGARGNGAATNGGTKKDRPRVPVDAEELARWRLGPDAGLDFAKLTGDFNPVHWIRPYARAFGFRNTILHGFSTMARAMEGLHRALFAGSVKALHIFDVQFTRPLVLPHRVGLYVVGDQVWVGDAPGGPAYLVGRFTRASDSN